jgi:hypothetical protein
MFLNTLILWVTVRKIERKLKDVELSISDIVQVGQRMNDQLMDVTTKVAIIEARMEERGYVQQQEAPIRTRKRRISLDYKRKEA